MGSDAPHEALRASTTRREAEQDLRLADHVIAGRHQPVMARQREL